MSSFHSTTAVIDDDPLFHWIIENRLETFKCDSKVMFFESGPAALDYLRKNQENPDDLPDKILLDLFMPEMNGLEFLDALGEIRKNIDKKISIFVITVSMDPHHRDLVTQHPEVDGYFVKPLAEPEFRKLYPEAFSS